MSSFFTVLDLLYSICQTIADHINDDNINKIILSINSLDGACSKDDFIQIFNYFYKFYNDIVFMNEIQPEFKNKFNNINKLFLEQFNNF